MSQKAILYLEDGRQFHGRCLESTGPICGEVVFNTSMSGYQEILTDPSYAGQIVVMTYPLIGNYGVNTEDVESSRIHVQGFVVKEFCRYHSNFRASQSLIDYLNEQNIVAIEGVDTRALTRHIREQGAMKAVIASEDVSEADVKALLLKTPSMTGSDWVQNVTTPQPYTVEADGELKHTIVAIDCGIKTNIIRIFQKLGCRIHVVPANTDAQTIMAMAPDGVFVSNGPGDPASVEYVTETVKACFGKVPVFGICLGHQIIGLALGGETYKLKFGHHGANHPVKDLLTQRVGITSQNHGFCLNFESLPFDEVELVDLNLNDQTVEGIRHRQWPIISYQHHPEAAPGPHDAQYLFQNFLDLMDSFKVNA